MYTQNTFLLMLGFEPRISDVANDHSAKCSTAIVHFGLSLGDTLGLEKQPPESENLSC